MPGFVYAEFIEVCRQERASLTGLIEALEGERMDPGAPLIVPGPMVSATAATLVALQTAVRQLNVLLSAYEASIVD
jgi:hypothetical protein